ncbi:MAG: 5'-3' exonuclease H3TH domain-containing protein [Actinomycetes bacterium]
MLVLLDTASLYYRAYYAMPESLTAPDGQPNNMLRGFLSSLTKLSRQLEPTALAACWDDDWRPQWRVDALPSYKTHRLADDAEGAEEVPDTLSPQIDALAQILDAAGIARPGALGYEADDIIATLAGAHSGPVTVVTGDRDMVQLVSERIGVLLTVNGGMEKWPLLTPALALERFGVLPSAYVDFAALRGDASDGIPGIPGIGPKTASALITHFGSLDAVLDAASSGVSEKPLTPRIAGLLVEHADQARKARLVSTAATDAPVLDLSTSLPESPVAPVDLDLVLEAWGVKRQFADLAKQLGVRLS